MATAITINGLLGCVTILNIFHVLGVLAHGNRNILGRRYDERSAVWFKQLLLASYSTAAGHALISMTKSITKEKYKMVLPIRIKS